MLIITSLVFLGCNQNIETITIDKDIEIKINYKLKQNIGVEPLDFQPYNSDINWTEEAWEKIKLNIDTLLPTLKLQGEIISYTPKQFVTITYENININIEQHRKANERIIVEIDNKHYLFHGHEQEVNNVLNLIKH